MRNKLIELEENIKKYQDKISHHYNNLEELLSQIEMILDFGISEEKLKYWYCSHQTSLQKVEQILEHIKHESFTY